MERIISDRIRDNLMVSFLTLIIVIGGAYTVVTDFVIDYDAMHVTQEELMLAIAEHTDYPHSVTNNLVERNSRRSQCSNIDVRIALLEDQIWRMGRETPGAQRIIEKQRDLRRLNDKREALNCTEFDT